MPLGIEVSPQLIEDFYRRHKIRRLSLFGSVLRPDFRSDSDVDMLVELEAGHRVGLVGMERELSEPIGRKVDLRTAGDLSPYFRDEALRSTVVQYAA